VQFYTQFWANQLDAFADDLEVEIKPKPKLELKPKTKPRRN